MHRWGCCNIYFWIQRRVRKEKALHVTIIGECVQLISLQIFFPHKTIKACAKYKKLSIRGWLEAKLREIM